MKDLTQLASSLLRDDSGQDVIEYAFAAGLIGVSAVLAMKNLRTDIASTLTSIWGSITSDF